MNADILLDVVELTKNKNMKVVDILMSNPLFLRLNEYIVEY